MVFSGKVFRAFLIAGEQKKVTLRAGEMSAVSVKSAEMRAAGRDKELDEAYQFGKTLE